MADGLAALTAAVEGLAAQDPDGLADPVRAERVLGLRRLLERLQGRWLAELAAVDAAGAAGADQGVQALSTASWLRNRLRMGAGAASGLVRTARALFGGPLVATAAAVTAGEVSVAHAAVLAFGTRTCRARLRPRPSRCWARRPAVWTHPAAAGHQPPAVGARPRRDRQPGRAAGRWLTSTMDGMVAVDGLLEPEAGQTLLAAWSRWPARPTPPMPAAAASARLMPWPSWPAAPWKPANFPRLVGPAPADGDGGPGQPPRPPRGGGRGRAVGARGLPAAGL